MAMLYLEVPTEIKKRIEKIDVPGKKLDTGKHHITLFYFLNTPPADKLGNLMSDVFDFLKDRPSFSINLEKVETFPVGKDGVPLIIKVLSKELKEFRKELEKIVNKHKIEFSTQFDFNPHLTLSYASENEEGFEMDIEKIEFQSNSVSYRNSKEKDGNTLNFHIPFKNKNAYNIDLLENLLKLT